jgi:hypothetical protein
LKTDGFKGDPLFYPILSQKQTIFPLGDESVIRKRLGYDHLQSAAATIEGLAFPKRSSRESCLWDGEYV